MSYNILSRSFRLILFICLVIAGLSNTAKAQRVALTTDGVEWLTGTANIGLETRLSRRLTLGVSVAGNPFRSMIVKDLRLANFRVQPQLRYWFNRPMAKHYVGVGLMGGMYDLILKKNRYKGDVFGAIASYGYALVLGKHWNVEFSGGIGLGMIHGYSYKTGDERPPFPNHKKVIPLPDLGVTFTYILK